MSYFDGPSPTLRTRGRARQRTASRNATGSSGLVQGCLILFTLCTAGLVFFGLILAPVMFRLLPYSDQGRIARRVDLLSPWMYTETPAPTPLSYTLPTVDPARLNASQTLLNGMPTPAAASNATALFAATPTPQTVVMATNARVTVPTLVPTNANAAPVVAVAGAPTDPPPPTPLPATDIPLPPKFHMTRYQWVPQGWNNCGPANLAQVLNGYGVAITQEELAAALKPNKDDANTSPWQIVNYVNEKTRYRALQRMNGSLKLIKTLMVAKFRVIIETGLLSPKDGSWEGHYVTPIGYDDGAGILYNLDSLLGAAKDNQGIHEEYIDLDTRWSHFNRVYIVVYSPEREGELRSILQADADPTQNVRNALAKANEERKQNPANAYAWFNVGSSYVMLKDYRNAAAAYDFARNAGVGLPWRMNWYQFGMLSAYYNIGDYKSALDQIELALANQKNVEELYYWRGLIAYAQGDAASATVDLNQTLKLNKNYKPARDALVSISRNEKPVVFDLP